MDISIVYGSHFLGQQTAYYNIDTKVILLTYEGSRMVYESTWCQVSIVFLNNHVIFMWKKGGKYLIMYVSREVKSWTMSSNTWAVSENMWEMKPNLVKIHGFRCICVYNDFGRLENGSKILWMMF